MPTLSDLPVATSDEPVQPRLAAAVVVHSGARDSYQLALALHEAGLLSALVTDLYFSQSSPLARHLRSWLPASLQELLHRRTTAALPAPAVRQCLFTGLRELLLARCSFISFALRRRSTRAADRTLGRTAGNLARRRGAGLVTYSYYASDAVSAYGQPVLLFQLHPHPATMRRLLQHELDLHADCAASLTQEWELALPEADFQKLVAEPLTASHLLAASSFTRESLIEHGIRPSRITVVPYGVDLEHFHPAPRTPSLQGPLRLLFVGRINQRKGIKYLLQAMSMLPPGTATLTVCGRVVDGLELFRNLPNIELRPSVSEADLLAAYQQADLFIFPSIAEGFGQVLLEALACGLPILSTTHTAAPDLIADGVEGFIVSPGRADLLADKVLWCSRHRGELHIMRALARKRAEHFTWARFRQCAATAVENYLQRPY